MADISEIQARLNQAMANQAYEKDPYPQYQLETFRVSEKFFMHAIPDITQKQIEAFVIANKADDAINKQQFRDANKMIYQAIAMDPKSIDAYRNLNDMTLWFTGDDFASIIAGFRELLYFSRFIYQPFIEAGSGEFYNCSETRPYMRILDSISNDAFLTHYFQIEVQSYEEALRLNNRDNVGSRFKIAALYLQCIISEYRNDHKYPVRTEEQLSKLFTTSLVDSEPERFSAFGPDYKEEYIYQWAQVITRYLKKDQSWVSFFEQVVLSEPEVFKALLRIKEIKVDKNNRFDPNQEKLNKYRLVAPFVYRTKGLLREIAKICLDGRDIEELDQFETVFDFDPRCDLENYEQQAEQLLNEGRQLMRDKKFREAITKLSEAKSMYDRANYPNFHTEQTNIPYPILSNRAQCFIQLGMWHHARIDIRFALMKKPDIPHLYKHLPLIADAFGSKLSKKRFIEIAEKAAKGMSPEEWSEMAKRVIGMLGLRALIGDRIGLTVDEIEEEIQRGAADMFTPICLGADEYPLLPWVNADEIETEVH